MLTQPRNRTTLDALQTLLTEVFKARDELYAAADALCDTDESYICRRFADHLGGHAADLQQISCASGVQPSEPQSEDDHLELLASIQEQHASGSGLIAAVHVEHSLAEQYRRVMGLLEDAEIMSLLEKQREDIELADCVLRRLTARSPGQPRNTAQTSQQT